MWFTGPLTEATIARDLERVDHVLNLTSNSTEHKVACDRFHALQIAVENDSLLIVHLLLSRGVQPSTFDFSVAVQNRSYAILELMLANGLDIKAASQAQPSSFWTGAFADPELVRWLVAHRADLNAPDEFGCTPFSIAAQSTPLETLILLLELGAAADQGYPLHSAIENNREEGVVQLLLNNGASPNAIEFEGKPKAFYDIVNGVGTPLHVAYRQGNDKLVQLLHKHGAAENIKDTKGRLPCQVRDARPISASL
ncbi:uncharacterized protein Z520_12399 [Fonsecaea multimorphosa CBS 102226]|uniref:Uncharacterized protein n=1 Tax=Fonsecaea multimorphosa CBS 102226 TaxID=1442371 RepID=A0A0D2JN40_9EURO|nr:uncharacterized protein Z520_12399 [Fonsecaea multimorphosa CBS 102226]KIX91894.1 hypothetical protein Z520_12399 [Fonsecaea multimorphosa CBS 102226]OAL17390.1 hypothetical protein AYO22_11701 [Fonsecaea multimorphosa]